MDIHICNTHKHRAQLSLGDALLSYIVTLMLDMSYWDVYLLLADLHLLLCGLILNIPFAHL